MSPRQTDTQNELMYYMIQNRHWVLAVKVISMRFQTTYSHCCDAGQTAPSEQRKFNPDAERLKSWHSLKSQDTFLGWSPSPIFSQVMMHVPLPENQHFGKS